MDSPDSVQTPNLPDPPAPPHDGEPQPTRDDPSAGGYYCAANRAPRQIAGEREARGVEPWPYCMNRAGRGTDHVGVGACRNHAGSTPNARKAAKLRLAELAGPSLATLARALTDPNCPWSVRVRAADSILDRAGHPRRAELDVDEAREHLVERISRLVDEGGADN